jgi:hypothetical protein
MSRVADQLRAEVRGAGPARSAEERVLLALRLGDSDAAILAAARGIDRAEARRILRAQRQAGRRRSRCASES